MTCIVISESVGNPRRSTIRNRELPSARLISSQMTRESNVADSIHNVMVMQMGQFIDHDITHTPNHGEVCCGKNGSLPCKSNKILYHVSTLIKQFHNYMIF